MDSWTFSLKWIVFSKFWHSDICHVKTNPEYFKNDSLPKNGENEPEIGFIEFIEIFAH